LVFWVCDLIWLIALVFGYRAAPGPPGWPLVGSWIPWVCVTILGFLALGLHVGA
jgi:hypothetical protein